MKHLHLFVTALLLATTLLSCSKKEDLIYTVSVQLTYPTGYSADDSVAVTLKNKVTNSSYTALTDAQGIAKFTVPGGVYEASSTETRYSNKTAYSFNGVKDFTVDEGWIASNPVAISLTYSQASQLVIKELYTGGCLKNDGSGSFSKDAYVILYNNSNANASLDSLCLGTVGSNSNATNYDYVNGVLSYESEGWIPALYGIWYFPNGIVLKPGQQIVVALYNAIDNTSTYSNSINFANSDYYCTYDLTQFALTSYYPSPSTAIPVSHYLKAVRYSGVTATAWTPSVNSPTFFIFSTKGVSPVGFANDASKTSLYNGSASQVRKKVPVAWVVDGVESFVQGATANNKRLAASVDAGYVYYTSGTGYTLYRNVDKAATEAISANAGKIVYSYSGGSADVAGGSTDPSGIDAEASVKLGARIIYKDTNNSTNDFHQRKKASLRN